MDLSYSVPLFLLLITLIFFYRRSRFSTTSRFGDGKTPVLGFAVVLLGIGVLLFFAADPTTQQLFVLITAVLFIADNPRSKLRLAAGVIGFLFLYFFYDQPADQLHKIYSVLFGG